MADDRPYYTCKGCQRDTRARSRLCRYCVREVTHGLWGGQWVLKGGIQVWVEDGAA